MSLWQCLSDDQLDQLCHSQVLTEELQHVFECPACRARLHLARDARGGLTAFSLFSAPAWPDTVMARDSLQYTVRFAPPDSASYRDTLIIYHDATGLPVRVALRGVGKHGIQLRPTAMVFDTTVMRHSDSLALWVLNRSNVVLNITALWSNNPAFLPRELHFTISPLDSHAVWVVFTPPDTFRYEGMLTCESDQGNRLVTLRGVGVWDQAVQDYADLVPTEFYLRQNYPNPFNPVTTIEYGVPRASRVLVSVFDLNGREMARLVDGRRNPGRFRVMWDGSGCATGVYFIAMTGEGFHQIRKAMLLK